MEEYVRKLEALQKIREIAGGQTLNLPQICVVGDQSSGKSSLLKLLTGVDFPVSAGTCTKAAIVVECKKQEEETYEIMDCSTKQYVECESFDLSDKILKCQKEMVNSGGDTKISQGEINIKVGGRNQINIIVVDLPGIINVGLGKNETRSLIRKYIEPEQTLIFLVSEAKTDAELISAVELAKECDPDGSRTMSVLTKFDTFDSDEARNRAQMWITENENNYLGAHAVIAAPDGKEYDASKEKDRLKKLPASRSGIEALKFRLPTIYAQLIQTNLSGLREGIEQKITQAKLVLNSVGEVPIESTAMIKRCQAFLLGKVTQIEVELTPSMIEVQEATQKKGLSITEEWTSSKFPPNVFKVPFFSGESAFKKCFSEIGEWWQPILDDYIVKVDTALVGTIDKLEEVSIPQTLSVTVASAWKDICQEMVKTLEKECKTELSKFKNFGTVNHYLTSEYQQELALPKDMIGTFISSLTVGAVSYNNAVGEYHVTETKKTIEKKLESVCETRMSEFNRKSLHDQQKMRLFAAVIAAYKIENKTFTDLIMKATNIHVLEAVANWINTDIFQNEWIKHAAKEDEATIMKRNKAMEMIKKMDACLTEVRMVM